MGDERSPVPEQPSRSGLSRREFEEVIRRASELASKEPDAGTSLSESELFRIAEEVGLPEEHVRRALVEVRSETIPEGGIRALRGSPWIRASRVVPGSREELAESIDQFLVGGRLLHPVRKGNEYMVYWPSQDWASQIARTASSTGRKYYIASAKRVEVRLRPVHDKATWVEIAVDPGIRGDSVAGAILGGIGGGVGVGVGAGVALAAVGPLTLAVAASVVAGSLAAGGVTWLVGRSYRNQMERVRLELEGVLDQLERGETLEPPPPSWQRWVSRHFRGIAKELRRLE
jgi:hypothetical protein